MSGSLLGVDEELWRMSGYEACRNVGSRIKELCSPRKDRAERIFGLSGFERKFLPSFVVGFTCFQTDILHSNDEANISTYVSFLAGIL